MAPRAGFARFQMKQRDADLVAAGSGGRGLAAQFAQGDAGCGCDDRQTGRIDNGWRRLCRCEDGQGGEQQSKWVHCPNGERSGECSRRRALKKRAFKELDFPLARLMARHWLSLPSTPSTNAIRAIARMAIEVVPSRSGTPSPVKPTSNITRPKLFGFTEGGRSFLSYHVRKNITRNQL